MNDAPRLAALWHPALRNFVDNHADLIHDLARGFDAPVHLLFPDRFAANVTAFESVLAERGVTGRVYYAKKANKAHCFARAAADCRIGVDVASVGEFADALAAGVRGTDIGVSGPPKATDLLRLALCHDALIAVDSPEELGRLVEIARSGGGRARVLLRMTPAASSASRFGMNRVSLDAALSLCAAHRSILTLEGFSFHLSGYRAQDRCDQAGIAVRACERARALDLASHTINIGGGFAMSYTSADDWRAFQAAQRPDDFHAKKTFDGFYPYHSPCGGARMLDAILSGIPKGEAKPLADLLHEHDLRIMLEPGRALLDQAGFTVFVVQGVKDRGDYGITTVNGTSFSLSEQWFASEFLPDPEWLPAPSAPAARRPKLGPYRSCVGGASCLDSDMITWRKVVFAHRPEPGDLLLYPNTAGYQMDSNESTFHELPLPPKLVVTVDGERARWRIDRPSTPSGV